MKGWELQERASDRVTIIPEDLHLFQATDIIKVFEEMEKRFHLHSHWHKQFRQELQKIERGISEEEFFFMFALKHLDPSLKVILRRNESVIFSIARYIIKDRVEEKKREAEAQRKFYRSDAWKKGMK